MFWRIVRYLLGWKPLSPPRQNTVVVFVHTSYLDGLLSVLYFDEAHLISVAKPQLFTRWSSRLLTYFGFLKAPKLEDRASGGVTCICNEIFGLLMKKALAPLTGDRSGPLLLVISPKGTLKNGPWRSGYKYIAEALGWPICAANVDYSRRQVVFEKEWPSLNIKQESAEIVEGLLKHQLNSSVPWTPDNSEVPVADHDAFERIAPFDIVTWSNITILWPVYKAFSMGHTATFFLGLANFLSSWYYHSTHECHGRLCDITSAKVSCVMAIIFYWQTLDLTTTYLALIASILYYLGTPRVAGATASNCKRGTYVVWHSLFHVLLSLTIYNAIK